MYSGSSPLARGLRLAAVAQDRVLRIIPARAGFTDDFKELKKFTTDHPRSRGVYSTSQRSVERSMGSSPLARGLRSLASLRRGTSGIIPARAGFTVSIRATTMSTGDHPRSRGVYNSFPQGFLGERGSSPLARGLLTVTGNASFTDGIIPARAGFTPWSEGSCTHVTDHPRSRGVYCARSTSSSCG